MAEKTDASDVDVTGTKRSASSNAGPQKKKKKKKKQGNMPDFSGIPERERMYVVAQRDLKRKHEHAVKNGFCDVCWLLPENCFCKYIEEKVDSPHRVLVFMHYKEFRRCSNTAKLVPMCMPNARIYVYGVKEDEAELQRLVAEAGPKALVLYPSPDAVHATSLPPMPSSGNGDVENGGGGGSGGGTGRVGGRLDAEVAPPAGCDGYTVVVVDGTWSNAKNLNHHIPASVKRVCITPEGRSLFAPLRTQSQEDRICTVEALVLLLKDLGLSLKEKEKFIHYLKVAVDACLLQTSVAPVYDTEVARAWKPRPGWKENAKAKKLKKAPPVPAAVRDEEARIKKEERRRAKEASMKERGETSDASVEGMVAHGKMAAPPT